MSKVVSIELGGRTRFIDEESGQVIDAPTKILEQAGFYVPKYSRYRIVPVGEGYFTVEMRTWFGYKPFIIHDINPGCGAREVWPMKARREDCERALRFLQRFQGKVKRHVDWRIMNRVKNILGISFLYHKV